MPGAGGKGNGEWLLMGMNGYMASLGDNENALKWCSRMIVALLFECTKKHWVVYFEQYGMQSYLDKAVIFFLKEQCVSQRSDCATEMKFRVGCAAHLSWNVTTFITWQYWRKQIFTLMMASFLPPSSRIRWIKHSEKKGLNTPYGKRKLVKLNPSMKWSEVKSLSCVWLFATPWAVAYQAPLPIGFSRQE